jgi:hypothetical protein
MARIDRKSISVVVMGALFFVIYALLILRRTYRCPDGHGIVLTRPNMNVKKICEQTSIKKVQERDKEEE